MPTSSQIVEVESVALTALAAVVLSVLHLAGKHLHRRLSLSERLTNSLFGGMAAAYVFLYLMPELEVTHEILGEAIHFLVLLGFLLFYGAEHYSRSRYRRVHGDAGAEAFTFHVRLSFLWIYNALFVYTIPERVEQSVVFFLINAVAIGLHIGQADYRLVRRHQASFDSYGRYVLAAAPLIAAAIDFLDGPTSEQLTDALTAVLAGFVLQNVFSEELPEHDQSDFRWFLTGIVGYSLLVSARRFFK